MKNGSSCCTVVVGLRWLWKIKLRSEGWSCRSTAAGLIGLQGCMRCYDSCCEGVATVGRTLVELNLEINSQIDCGILESRTCRPVTRVTDGLLRVTSVWVNFQVDVAGKGKSQMYFQVQRKKKRTLSRAEVLIEGEYFKKDIIGRGLGKEEWQRELPAPRYICFWMKAGTAGRGGAAREKMKWCLSKWELGGNEVLLVT